MMMRRLGTALCAGDPSAAVGRFRLLRRPVGRWPSSGRIAAGLSRFRPSASPVGRPCRPSACRPSACRPWACGLGFWASAGPARCARRVTGRSIGLRRDGGAQDRGEGGRHGGRDQRHRRSRRRDGGTAATMAPGGRVRGVAGARAAGPGRSRSAGTRRRDQPDGRIAPAGAGGARPSSGPASSSAERRTVRRPQPDIRSRDRCRALAPEADRSDRPPGEKPGT